VTAEQAAWSALLVLLAPVWLPLLLLGFVALCCWLVEPGETRAAERDAHQAAAMARQAAQTVAWEPSPVWLGPDAWRDLGPAERAERFAEAAARDEHRRRLAEQAERAHAHQAPPRPTGRSASREPDPAVPREHCGDQLCLAHYPWTGWPRYACPIHCGGCESERERQERQVTSGWSEGTEATDGWWD
jgi:hypothetical protein